ncbi:UDP-N-acetylglucosamine 2-epimerase (non-hydrolyzing) [bacterium (Candidatus Blackallbacteria) CG17_big_fil_post_rev_8_21_14_2_50_48_46]|uniref:UDP-N-acetylglucosamine 2-epimerase (non-hydrolyzing) n=1 Tax=bacterium (Candidatus Blackallbacteria) CG17_big_fil_post_rev_8_21_14_2_50_48_46 TaxID=2014261 RepID=A0A2M7FX39_9BACT|nr:MAG: UDP-N-acetylglucosamine 2-epimerase (non-hydrolyzing) [bacterium (Candidatus Blackallbacteria) CG18_big_fil_WC_8_21_14_2_50_49_26]PIW13827.1 MAG: UDP-N-acetylglucosamine 2-epimerase (non-hydrolyzing) [bacterium (Candidatus Blackallbacteria) CG17_big_fil_post_rev_8_21_14_2_50_48_46]PIW45053.1 MAG: UDP-N-acetylglucosamine 2-epimerase (non-hydrolyzing) [bacterium (Candidatus Blackallbacteria) CG13_big_fil_rev_8_21_14_2_50_49_14]
MKKILVVFGTRPEIIKMFPVIEELKRSEFNCQVLTTAQHREMTDMFMQTFGIQPDIDLDLMQDRQTLPDLTARIMQTISPVLVEHKPDMVLVQGDTTTVMVTALAAAYQQIPVGHVEAGLRTDQLFNPFPEEINRRLCGQLTRLHFAPTPRSEASLLAENIPAEWIYRTGNTVIDAILRMHARHPDYNYPAEIGLDLSQGQRLVLVTAHRRENWGLPLEQICKALLSLCESFPDLRLVFPVHRNPVVRETVFPMLGEHPQIRLIEPVDYIPLMDLIRRSSLVLTDSGGIQEEAPSLGKPVLVMRETTERPEGVEMGTAKLVGTDPEKIIREATHLLQDSEAYAQMSRAINPYGDGRAAERIVQALRHYFGLGERPEAFDAAH